MALPPAEENLDVPSELVGKGNLFGGEVVAVGGDPVINTVHPIADQADFPFRLIDTGGSQKNDGVKKDNAVGLDGIRSNNGLFRGGFDSTDKVFVLCLPDVKELMALVASIHDARFPRRQDHFYKRTFRLLAVAEKDFLGNTAIEIESNMNLSLFRALPVVGPVHGQHRINEGSVN